MSHTGISPPHHHHHGQMDLSPLLHLHCTLSSPLLWVADALWSPEQHVSVSHQAHGKYTLELTPGTGCWGLCRSFHWSCEKTMIKMIYFQNLSWFMIVNYKLKLSGQLCMNVLFSQFGWLTVTIAFHLSLKRAFSSGLTNNIPTFQYSVLFLKLWNMFTPSAQEGQTYCWPVRWPVDLLGCFF